MVKRLRGATRYSTGSRTINEALHRTNSSVRTYYPGRRSHKLVKTVCQNFEGTYLGTFPITTGRSSSDGGIWLQYRARGYPKHRGVGLCHCYTRELPVGIVPSLSSVEQLSSVSSHLPSRALSLWDSEYGCAPFVNQTAEFPVDKLMRLRSNLCLWGIPAAYGGRGRPKVHGDKFKLNDPMTWSSPVQQIEMDDPTLGKVRVQVWHNYHFRLSPAHPMSVLLVERLTTDGFTRVSKPMWLAFTGLSMPTVTEVWRLYLRRFAIDHWYRASQKSSTLDSSCIKYTRSMRAMERFNADCYLAIMVGPSACRTASSPLAEIPGQTHSWTSSSIFWEHFSRVRYTCSTSQTSR